MKEEHQTSLETLENDMLKAKEALQSENQSKIETLKKDHKEELEALQTGIQEELKKQIADQSVTHQESESKHVADKSDLNDKITQLELKVHELEVQLTQKEKTLQLKEQDVLEVERELETKQTKIIELTSDQVKRIEDLQNQHAEESKSARLNHEKALTELKNSHKTEVDSLITKQRQLEEQLRQEDRDRQPEV